MAETYGGWCGLILGAISVISFLLKIKTLFVLYFGNKLSARNATTLTFNLNSALRQRLLPLETVSNEETITTENVTTSTPMNTRPVRPRTFQAPPPSRDEYLSMVPVHHNRNLTYEIQ